MATSTRMVFRPERRDVGWVLLAACKTAYGLPFVVRQANRRALHITARPT